MSCQFHRLTDGSRPGLSLLLTNSTHLTSCNPNQKGVRKVLWAFLFQHRGRNLHREASTHRCIFSAHSSRALSASGESSVWDWTPTIMLHPLKHEGTPSMFRKVFRSHH